MKSGRPKIVQMAYQRLRANVNCLQHAEQKMHLISSFLHIFLLISLCVFIATIFSIRLLFSQLLFFITKFTPFLAHFTLSYFLQESSSFSSSLLFRCFSPKQTHTAASYSNGVVSTVCPILSLCPTVSFVCLLSRMWKVSVWRCGRGRRAAWRKKNGAQNLWSVSSSSASEKKIFTFARSSGRSWTRQQWSTRDERKKDQTE